MPLLEVGPKLLPVIVIEAAPAVPIVPPDTDNNEITGAVYDGRFGVGDANVTNQIGSNLSQEIADRQASDANLQQQIDFLTSNTDPATLDSLTEIVTAFQDADASAQLASTTDLTNLENTLRNDLSVPVATYEAPQFFYGDGSTVNFTLNETPGQVEAIDVYVNSVLQHTDVFTLSGNVITFSTVPQANDEIYVKYRSSFATVNVLPDNSVKNVNLDLTYTSTQSTGTVNNVFTIPAGHNVHSILVIIDGLIQPPTNYTVNGTTLTLNTNPNVSSIVDIRYMPV